MLSLYCREIALATGSSDKSIKIWDLNTSACLLTLMGHADIIMALTVLENSNLVSGSYDHTIKVWDVEKVGVKLRGLGHLYSVNALVVLPKNILVSGSEDEKILSYGICIK